MYMAVVTLGITGGFETYPDVGLCALDRANGASFPVR